jgi:hypothetical protein
MRSDACDPDLKDSFTQNGPRGEVIADMKYSTDGKETTNSVRGNQIRSTAKWDGDELAIAGKTLDRKLVMERQ